MKGYSPRISFFGILVDYTGQAYHFYALCKLSKYYALVYLGNGIQSSEAEAIDFCRKKVRTYAISALDFLATEENSIVEEFSFWYRKEIFYVS